MSKTITALVSLLLTLTPSLLLAENWPQLRGPNFDGSSPETGLPTTFTTTENVKWVTPMPGPSAATPIVWDDYVFVSSTDSRSKTLHGLCLDRKTGKILWHKQLGLRMSQDNKSNFASPSPATDGKLVVFFYGTGDLSALDFQGKELWSRNLQKDYGEFAFQWTFSTSPLLHDGKLYLQVLQRNVPANGRGRKDGPNESYLLALNPRTGKELWKHIRPSEAKAESLEAFTTPIPYTHNGRPEILIAGGDCLTGHDPDNGKELWRWGTWNPSRIGHWRLVPSPVAGQGVILACAPKKSPVYAVKAGGQGLLTDASLAWTSSDSDISSDVSTPLFYRDHFYILNSDKKTISCVEPTSGKVLWTGDPQSRSKIESSPTAADGRIYFMNHAGDVFVIAAGPEFKLLHTANFADPGDRELRPSIAIAHKNLFIRPGANLYCIGE